MNRLCMVLALLLCLLCACAAPQTPASAPEEEAPVQTVTAGENAAQAQPDAEEVPEETLPEQTELSAQSLPESCRGWFDIPANSGAAEKFDDPPLAPRADEGVSNEFGYSFRTPDGRDEELALNSVQDGVSLDEFSGGGARQAASYAQIVWNGEAYHAFTIDAESCAIPNLRPNGTSLLRLNITGDCTVDAGGSEYACFDGFDCVLITGSGTLRIENTAGLGSGGGTLPLPALMLDGDVTLICDRLVLLQNKEMPLTLAQLGGTLCTEVLSAEMDEALLAGGAMLCRSAQGLSRMTFRGGTALIDAFEGVGTTLVLSGGEAYVANELRERTVIEGGSGTLTALDGSNAEIHDYGAAIAFGEDAVSRYFQTAYDDSWVDTSDRSDITWQSLELTQLEDVYFAGRLYMENAFAQSILPWGALHLTMTGSSQIAGELGGTGLLLDGGGALTTGAVNVWGWGGIHHPIFAVRDADVTVQRLSMGSNSGEQGRLLVENGSLHCEEELWLQNAALEIHDGTLRVDGGCSIEKGRIEITGGELYLVEGVWLGEGDIVITGGEVIVPGGLDALCAEHGEVIVDGGTVREP